MIKQKNIKKGQRNISLLFEFEICNNDLSKHFRYWDRFWYFYFSKTDLTELFKSRVPKYFNNKMTELL